MSKQVGSPCLTGAYSCTYNLGVQGSSFATNNIASYSRRIDEIDCSTGAVAALVYEDPSPVIPADPNGSLYALSLNAITINGSTGYFLDKTGHCYRLTITVSNVCSSASDWSYFRIDGPYDNPLSYAGLSRENEHVRVFPNPAKDQVTFSILLAADEDVSIEISDAGGKIIARPLTGQRLAAGENRVAFSVASLQRGLYFYRVVSSKTFAGKFAKID
jgi:hypothetical protein